MFFFISEDYKVFKKKGLIIRVKGKIIYTAFTGKRSVKKES